MQASAMQMSCMRCLCNVSALPAVPGEKNTALQTAKTCDVMPQDCALRAHLCHLSGDLLGARTRPPPAVDRRQVARLCVSLHGRELLVAAEAGVGLAGGHQPLHLLVVDRLALALPVRAVLAAHIWPCDRAIPMLHLPSMHWCHEHGCLTCIAEHGKHRVQDGAHEQGLTLVPVDA
jgi:hypothetical protein